MNLLKLSFVLVLISFLTACSTTMSAEEKEKLQNKKIAQINVQLGMGYLERNDMQRAKEKLLNALDYDPTLPEAWYSMAYFQERTGNKSEAKKDYQKAIALAPQRGDVQNNYGTFLCHNGDYRESVQHFILATQDPQYLDVAGAYENAGLCALKIPDTHLAKEYFTRSIEQDPTRETAMTELTKLR